MADPIRVSFACVDSNGKRVTVPLLLPSTTTLAEIGTTATGFATLLDAVTGTKVSGATVELPVDISGATIKGDPDADSMVTDGHLFGFAVSGSDYRWSARVPFVQRSKVTGDTLNEADADVVALAAGWTNGIGADPDPTDGAERDLISFLGSKHSPRKA